MGLYCFICWLWYSVICSFLTQSRAHFMVGCLGWWGTLPTFMKSVLKIGPQNVYGINTVSPVFIQNR
jgi:hypothetical protein